MAVHSEEFIQFRWFSRLYSSFSFQMPDGKFFKTFRYAVAHLSDSLSVWHNLGRQATETGFSRGERRTTSDALRVRRKNPENLRRRYGKMPRAGL